MEKAVSAKGKYLIANVLWRLLERVTNWRETYSQFCEPVVAGCSTISEETELSMALNTFFVMFFFYSVHSLLW